MYIIYDFTFQIDKRSMKPKIWLYKDKVSGRSKGECTVTYDDADAAKSAITWFDGKDFRGSTIKVQMATHKSNWAGGTRGKGRGAGAGGGGFGGGGRGGGGSGGGMGGGGGGGGRGDDRGGREGDWRCANPDCGKNLFNFFREYFFESKKQFDIGMVTEHALQTSSSTLSIYKIGKLIVPLLVPYIKG